MSMMFVYLYAIAKYPDKFKIIKSHTLEEAEKAYENSVVSHLKKLLDLNNQ